MIYRLQRWAAVALAASVAVGGCQNCCRRPTGASLPPPPPAGAYPPGPIRSGPPTNLPPYGAAPSPYGGPAAGMQQAPPPPVPIQGDTRNYGSLPEPSWQPSTNGSARPGQSLSRDPVRDPVRLYAPEPADGQPTPRTPPAELPPVADRLSPSPSLPVGIPQFAMAGDRVANGLKPMLEGGLDWLRDNNYRAVLHLREPGVDDEADRKQVEKRGMTYRSLEVSPAALNRTLVEDFGRIVQDTREQPLFVYDKNGTLAGGLWYLHFRLAQNLSDDEARRKASRLGLTEPTTEEQKTMWLAIEKLLSQRTGA